MHALPCGSIAILTSTARANDEIGRQWSQRMISLMARYAQAEPFRWVTRGWTDRQTAAHKISEDPTFAPCDWRNGFTYLQQFKGFDSRMVSPPSYDGFFIDATKVTRRWMKPPLSGAAVPGFPNAMYRVPLGFDTPGETDVALCNQPSQISYIRGFLVPGRFNDWLDRYDLEPGLIIARAWLKELDSFVRMRSWAKGWLRVLLKSSGDTDWVKLLAQRCLDARFAFIHRDPISVIHSNSGLRNVVPREYRLQNVSDKEAIGTSTKLF
jgi:hypothetical protein